MVWVCLGLRRHCYFSPYFHPKKKTQKKRFHFCNTCESSLKINTSVRQPSSHTQAVPESSSQPVTENTPLFDNQQGTHQLCSVNVLNQVFFFCYYV
ncbi:hypothetical protein ACOSQ2_015093 [Xanthoceras sorbifolium]